MDEGKTGESLGTPEHVFKDYKARREGLVKALTSEVDSFHEQCDPEKENMCLYGFPDGSWEVQLPADEVPPELPEPALGINFARDGMRRSDWLALVAVHSDAWLMAVAFYYGAKFGPADRERLFNLINELPTVFEIQSGRNGRKKKSGQQLQSQALNYVQPAHQSIQPQQTRAAELLDGLGTLACVAERSPGEILHLPDKAEDYYHLLFEKKVELMWPEDGYWYRAVVSDVRPQERRIHVYYVGGEFEEIVFEDLNEIASEGQCNIISSQ